MTPYPSNFSPFHSSSSEEWTDAVYLKAYYLSLSYILKNTGSIHEAEDIFHEACCVYWEKRFLLKIKNPNTTVNYLFTTCRNLWLKYLKKRNRVILKADFPYLKSPEYFNIEKGEALAIRDQSLQKAIETLDEESKIILNFLLINYSFKDIAEELGYENPDYLRLKKFRIKKRLKTLIAKSPFYDHMQEWDDFHE